MKRPLDLVRSVEALRRDERLIYLVVGDGPLRSGMEETCRQAGIHYRFRFVGWVDYSEMPSYLNLVDVLVVPSESEALARVYVETQACGRALLASDIPAAREIIADGETGLLFRLGDVGDLTGENPPAGGRFGAPRGDRTDGPRARRRPRARSGRGGPTGGCCGRSSGRLWLGGALGAMRPFSLVALGAPPKMNSR